MIMHNTTVENVVIPANRITPLGVRITTQAEADALPELTEANDEFKHEVQEVNVEFAESYIALFEQLGRTAVEGIGPNPVTSLNPASSTPIIGDGASSPSWSASSAMSASARRAPSDSAPPSAPTKAPRSSSAAAPASTAASPSTP